MKVALGSMPDPEVAALPKRRQFSAAYKRRIVGEANACRVPGEVGALLRREGLYSSHLTHWRREVEASEQAALAPKRRGPKPDLAKAESRRVEVLEREVTRLRQKLGRAEQIIEAQKKLCELLGLPMGEEPSRLNSAMMAIAPQIGIAAACIGLGVARATFYRAQRPVSVQQANVPRASSPRALSTLEQHTILDWLHEPTYADLSPRTVFAMLLDAGRYLASVSTFYRLLRASGETRGRRNELTHPAYAKPELLASGPRELWSWDITKLKGPAKWVCFHLYVILDVFSRYVVGWMIAPRESAELAYELIAATCDKEGIVRGQLTLHADRGTSMRSKPVALLLADLGVTKSHSRPHVSDDNPYSEAQFKTLKYQPAFPARFDSIEHARAFCQGFFAWYNHAHRHSGIGYMTPAAVHTGQAPRLYAARQRVLDQAFVAHPERFTRRHPTPPAVPVHVGINFPKPTLRVPGEAQRSTLNSPQLASQSC
ncbi:MAG: IS3 family transposase [Chloroflexota bacterium]|nr:IS3 family transposase [Chloroflexota bacterium]